MATEGPDPDWPVVQGLQVGDHNVQNNVFIQSGQVARSAYLQQVRRIAPRRLVDREQELAQLAAFCTEQGHGSYLWWRAPAWAGKSALLSWFVLHPPPGVRVVSFFVTARFAGQNDRLAFVDVVLEQLAEILGQPMPTYLTDATRDAHLLGTLVEAIDTCRRRDQRLVLVVDGLDEDRGVTAGMQGHSIAALLPARPPSVMRVVVSGRPDPPIPADVPDDHPLRDPGVVRVLTTSAYAHVVRADAQRELRRLLCGTRAEQDMLGLVTAAGGGLSGADLTELTGLPTWRIEDDLHAVSGRTFTRRTSLWRPDAGPEVYVLGHEELQNTAADYLDGARLEDYRRRLHSWADSYRERRWPPGTPEYLLQGYFRMLLVTGNLALAVACATDASRHDRMLDLIGGPAAALGEIAAAQELILDHADPDLVAMARLARHRDELVEHVVNIPDDLPAVWASLGHVTRAEATARSLPDPQRRARVLAAVAEAVAAAGDLDRAQELVVEAEIVARSIPGSYEPVTALMPVVRTVAVIGDMTRVAALTRTFTSRRDEAWAITVAARAKAETGDADQARMLAREAETVAGSVDGEDGRESPLVAAAEVLAVVGDPDQAVAIARSFADPRRQARALSAVAGAIATAGDPVRAEVVARSITDQWQREQALITVAQALAAAGDWDRAGALARSITHWSEQATVLVSVSEVLAAPAAPSRAGIPALAACEPTLRDRMLVDVARATAAAGDPVRAEALAHSITDQWQREQALIAVAQALAAAGAPDRAMTLVHPFAVRYRREQMWPEKQLELLGGLVKVLAASGEPDRAEVLAGWLPLKWEAESLTAAARATANDPDRAQALALADRAEQTARAITNPDQQARTLISVVEALATAGDTVRIRAWADHALVAAHAIADAHRRRDVVVAVARALAAAGAPDRAEIMADTITNPYLRADALILMAQTAAADGDQVRAEALARSITDLYRQEQALVAAAGAIARSGDPDRAEEVARSITNPHWRAEALIAVAQAAAATGDPERAQSLARSIGDIFNQERALATVAVAIAGGGDLAVAVAVAHSIRDPIRQAQALIDLAHHLDPARSRPLLAQAFRLADWTKPLNALARTEPTALATLADEFLKPVDQNYMKLFTTSGNYPTQ